MSNPLDRLFQLMPQGTLGNRYRLERCLGDGTYGFVWKAERLDDHELVAVKIPKAQGGKNSDLEEGRELIDTPRHPNVVSVYWMGRVPPEREVFAIEMEYFNSNTLAFLLDSREERLVASYRHLLRLYEQVLDGVCHLHSMDISHGDIKPQNILVQGDLVKLTDFGSSLTTQDFYARSRENGGTILYSPPEFAGLTTRKRDGPLAVAHDVYSLGVLLYQLLTGQLPHDTLAQVVRHAPFPRPRELSTSIAPELEAIVMRALERRPENRWDSVDAMRDAFERAQKAQLAFRADRVVPAPTAPRTDWSTRVLELMSGQDWRDAEAASRAEYHRSGDAHAFLLMVRAATRDGRYFDALQMFEASPDVLASESPVIGDLEQLALAAYIRTERVREATMMIERCIGRQGERPGLMLRKASLLGIQAQFSDAAKILTTLNRQLPRRSAILRRLVMVHEQLRDFEKAAAYEKVLAKIHARPSPTPGQQQFSDPPKPTNASPPIQAEPRREPDREAPAPPAQPIAKAGNERVSVQLVGTRHRITTSSHCFQLLQTEPAVGNRHGRMVEAAIYIDEQAMSSVEKVALDSVSAASEDRTRELPLTMASGYLDPMAPYQLVISDAESSEILLRAPVAVDLGPEPS